jgi:DNA-binding transcriptional regulator YhcF (GntR family)
LKIAVDKNAPIPAYKQVKQVVDGIAQAIGRGDAERGSRLPSVRNLAHDLGLNVNTVARAYRDLERAGVIQTMPGMGSFVPEGEALPAGWSTPAQGLGNDPATAIRGFGSRPQAASPRVEEPIFADWRDWLAAAHSLARAEGVGRDAFLEQATALAGRSVQTAPLLVSGPSAGEASDLLRALPPEAASDARLIGLEGLSDALSAGDVEAVLTSFPAQGSVRAALGSATPEGLELIPIETEYAESTVRDLSALPAEPKLALVTVEKEHWDNEANDVMKIIGRTGWLKMIFLEHGERGLAERLGQVDVILHVPRAREALAALNLGEQRLIELTRQVTARTRRRLDVVLAAHRS